MAGPDDDLGDLDDLLSSLPPAEDGDARPGTEMLGADVASEAMPAIRTPLPPRPPEPVTTPAAFDDAPAAPPAAFDEAPAAFADHPPVAFDEPIAPANASASPPPISLDVYDSVDELMPPLPEGVDDSVNELAVAPNVADPELAFALAEAEAESPAAELRAAASEAAMAARRKAAAAPIGVEEALPAGHADVGDVFVPEKRGLPTIVWVGVISFAVAALGAILYTQIDAFHPERQQTRDNMAEGAKERALAAHRRAQPVPGTVTINASESDAAVWLLLGRTPLESITVPSDQVHEVRFELLDRQIVDATIDRTHWSTDGGKNKATLSATLPRGRAAAPAYPAEKSVKPPPGPKGRGELRLESKPAGARAWLLIGFTPEVQLTGIETGRRYEFRVAKDGFLPAYTVVEESDWSSGRTEATRSVTLAPARTARK